jgi:hypothetical protein
MLHVRKAVAEFVGTTLRSLSILGSGSAVRQLSPVDVALELVAGAGLGIVVANVTFALAAVSVATTCGAVSSRPAERFEPVAFLICLRASRHRR